ncbi:hypothetical protein VTO73DRAFT_12583 [Trametes versicolor]
MPLELNGYSAHVNCDGKELETYDVRMEDERTISCWIPSEEGKTFIVHWGDDSSSTTMRVDIFMDGRKVEVLAHENKKTEYCRGAIETSDSLRPFLFAPLVLTDDDALLHSDVSGDIGTIHVEMRRVQRYTKNKTNFRGRHVPEIGSVHERSKKAGVHAVALGQPQEVTVESWTARGVDKEPFATFKFRYRPLELLQANGIAPLPGSSVAQNKRPLQDELNRAGPSSSSRKRRHTPPVGVVKPEAADDADDDDDDDDMQFLEEQLQMMQRRVEEARAAKRAKKAVKREMSPIHIPSSDDDEVIDLT